MLAETVERWKREAMEAIAASEARGRAEGEAKGKTEGRIATVLKMLKKGLLPLEDIAEYSDMPVDEVRKLQAQMQAA